ncbi:MAG: hypothetical protein IKG40_01740 [Bacilli bacterium]|nr:hypothetical protein [Bacilli bacterium]
MVTQIFKIETEIQVIHHTLYETYYNLLPSQRKYLNEKLEDLIHCYLLEQKRIGVLNVKGNKNLNEANFTVEANKDIVPTLS